MIDICTPIYLHAPMIRKCSAYAPVICEKPVALSVREAESLLDIQQKVGIVYQFRLNPKVIALKRDIEKGVYGDIKLIQMNYFRWRGQDYYRKWEHDKFKAGGGVGFNVCIHYFDLLQWIFGYPLTSYGHATTSKFGLSVEDNMVASFTFPTGAIASLSLSTHVKPPKHFEFSIYGTKGHKTIQLRHNEYHKKYFQNFLEGEYVDIREALKSLRMVHEIYNCSYPNRTKC